MEILSPPHRHLHACHLHPAPSNRGNRNCQTPSLKSRTVAAIAPHSSSAFSRIQLRRPQRRLPEPIEEPHKVNTTSSITAATSAIPGHPGAGTTCTTSDVLRLMDSLRLRVPINLYASLIRECTERRDAGGALELHRHIDRSRIGTGLPLLNLLIIMYSACGCIGNARNVFDKMSVKDQHSWAAMIAGCAYNDEYDKVCEMFTDFLLWRDSGGSVVFEFPASGILVCVLKACVHTFNLEFGKQIHGWLMKNGHLANSSVKSSLIGFYRKIGSLNDADIIFHQTSHPE